MKKCACDKISKTPVMKGFSKGGGATLTAAILASCLSFSPTAYAEDSNVIASGAKQSSIDLSQKPVNTPTLDYLRENNIKIPQKGAYDPDTKTWAEAPSIDAPESAYEITGGTADDHSFEYKTYNEDGTVTSSYYKINLKSSPFAGEDLGEGGCHITWQEVSAPAEGTDLPADTIAVKLPNDVTKYYQYTYNKPADYAVKTGNLNLDDATVPEGITPSYSYHYIFEGGAGQKVQAGETVTIENILFKDNVTSKTNMPRYTDIAGSALYNAGEITKINADFLNNSVQRFAHTNWRYTDDVYGGAIHNSGLIHTIKGSFINNNAAIKTTASTGQGGAISNNGQINSSRDESFNRRTSG